MYDDDWKLSDTINIIRLYMVYLHEIAIQILRWCMWDCQTEVGKRQQLFDNYFDGDHV